jgi:hypothetical protein
MPPLARTVLKHKAPDGCKDLEVFIDRDLYMGRKITFAGGDGVGMRSREEFVHDKIRFTYIQK